MIGLAIALAVVSDSGIFRFVHRLAWRLDADSVTKNVSMTFHLRLRAYGEMFN